MNSSFFVLYIYIYILGMILSSKFFFSDNFEITLCFLIVLMSLIGFFFFVQDYINESDNLVSLHSEIRECDSILTQMESLLGGFQVIQCFHF